MGQVVITPESRTEPFLELSRTPKGRLFRKHILSTGPLHANGTTIDVDEKFMQAVVDNFNAKYCDIVQVPIVGRDNSHSEDPRDNIGEVVNLTVEDGKLYSYIDSRKEDASNDLGKTLIGASAMFSTDYTDTTTNTRVGPTLLHVAITNRPHVLNLEDFEEVVALSGSNEEVIMLSATSEDSTVEPNELEENQTMELDELLTSLKADHGIDVTALQDSVATLTADLDTKVQENETLAATATQLQAEVTASEDLAVKLSNSIKEHLKSEELIKLSADADATSQVETLIAAVADAGSTLSQQTEEIVSLSGRIGSLEDDKLKTAAAAHVDELVSAGRILPVQRESMVELRLSNTELFDKIVPETPLIELSREDGSSEEPAPNTAEYVESEVSRLKAI